MAVTGPSPSAIAWTASNISVATTTLAGMFGGYFYSTAFSNYLILGLWFGGASYSTTAGTFAINWSADHRPGQLRGHLMSVYSNYSCEVQF